MKTKSKTKRTRKQKPWFTSVAGGAGCPVCDRVVCADTSHKPKGL